MRAKISLMGHIFVLIVLALIVLASPPASYAVPAINKFDAKTEPNVLRGGETVTVYAYKYIAIVDENGNVIASGYYGYYNYYEAHRRYGCWLDVSATYIGSSPPTDLLWRLNKLRTTDPICKVKDYEIEVVASDVSYNYFWMTYVYN